MRHIISYIATILIAVAANAQTEKKLVIFHTNDTHSCIMPMNENLADTAVAGRGGFLRRIAMLEEERKKNPDMMYFDSGDFSQGSAYYTMYKGEVEVGLMNMMGITAATLGNHEWDYGMEQLAKNIRQATFPVVCTNCDFTDTPLEKLVKPYIIIKRNGVKIGVIGVTTQLEGLVDKKNYQNVQYLDPVKSAGKTAEMLKEKKKCDIIVCISHLGWSEQGDIDFIKNTRHIDLVLGGHTHTKFKELRYVENLDGKPVAVDQNGKGGVNISKITLLLEKK